MFKKVSLVLSVLAALGFAVATSAPVEAAQQKNVHVNRSVHVNRTVNVRRNVTVNRNVRVNRNVGVNRVGRVGRANFVVGQRHNGHLWFGHNRHQWHGVWYGYGIGPCWFNDEGEWFWNDVACP